MELRQILAFFLAAFAAGGVLFALAYPWLTQDRAERRQKLINDAQTPRASANTRETALRRGQVADSLKELERRQKNLRNPPLTVRLEQAGLADWTPKKFYMASVISALALGFILLVTAGPYLALAGLFIGGLGVPRWMLKRLKNRRQARFLKEFPNAIDIIVRGVKSGLPLGDCFRIVSSESQEPVKSEFRTVIEMQAVGVPLDEAIDRFYQRLGLPEANFFSIVIAIQSKSGGNLSEALGNLATVLRDRHKMKGKIQAMSMEAKTSAWIIGSLPVIVACLVYIASPDYISALWQKNLGLIMLAICGFWMMCGVLTMRKMINFDF